MNNSRKADPIDRGALLERFAAEQDPFVAIGQRFGVDALDAILGIFGAGTISVPSRENFWKRLERTLRDERIRAEFTGHNHAELAERWDMTTRQVRNILAAGK